MAVDRALTIARKLCSAVEYAHQRKVIHRDIKPANILLAEQGEPKLTDFGLARQMDRNRPDKTMMGASIGSRGYMAPEQEINAATVDSRADVYALGGTLWFMLTGQNPVYFRESPERSRYCFRHRAPSRLSKKTARSVSHPPSELNAGSRSARNEHEFGC